MSKIEYFTGVGSRKVPRLITELITKLSAQLSPPFILRSGGAPGCDIAFEKGAGSVEIYLPSKDFRGHPSPLYTPSKEAIQMASEIHPLWNNLSSIAKLLHARNCHQVLGPNLDLPSKFLVCWTPDGAEMEKECSIKTGGTATAIKVASRNKVPVFNLCKNLKSKLQRILDLTKE